MPGSIPAPNSSSLVRGKENKKNMGSQMGQTDKKHLKKEYGKPIINFRDRHQHIKNYSDIICKGRIVHVLPISCFWINLFEITLRDVKVPFNSL
jgi:hypothetical protein